MWHQLYPLDGPKTPQWMLPLSHLVSPCSLLWIHNESHVKNPILLSQGFHHINFSLTRISVPLVLLRSLPWRLKRPSAESIWVWRVIYRSTEDRRQHLGVLQESCSERLLAQKWQQGARQWAVGVRNNACFAVMRPLVVLCCERDETEGKRRWPAIRTLWMSQFSSPEAVEVSISLPFLPTRLKTNPCAVINGIVSLLLRYVSMWCLGVYTFIHIPKI